VTGITATNLDAPGDGPRVRAWIGLGGNLGDPADTLARAVGALAALPGVRPGAVSALYATRPVGVENQPQFTNAAAGLDVPAGPDPASGALALLVALKALERSFGRRPTARWGPRAIDLDLLLFGSSEIVVERAPASLSIDAARDLGRRPDRRLLIVPHPELHARLFALAPLADVAPALVPPGWQETIAQARDRRRGAEGPDAVRRIGTWDSSSRRWAPVERPEA